MCQTCDTCTPYLSHTKQTELHVSFRHECEHPRSLAWEVAYAMSRDFVAVICTNGGVLRDAAGALAV